MSRMRKFTILPLLAVLLVMVASACSSDEVSEEQASDASDVGVRLISASDGADILASPPANLVVLDVRTQEEFDSGYIENAELIDFYAPDFETKIGELDRDVPYLIYCRSGNRSGQTAELMKGLGFADVVDVDGGIVAWNENSLPIQAP